MSLFIGELNTPIGKIVVSVDESGHLHRLDWDCFPQQYDYPLMNDEQRESLFSPIRAYFSGDLAALERLTVSMNGTPFQQQVWQALRAIPCGEIISYGELAQKIGSPKAARAVGMANNRNPIALVVPCHRVIGHSGKLVGYAGGLERKKWLLQHEGYHAFHL